MTKLKCTLSGVQKRFTSKSNNEICLTEVYVHDPSRPYPLRVEVFGDLKLPAGDYSVPFMLSDKDGRLGIDLNFSQATPLVKA